MIKLVLVILITARIVSILLGPDYFKAELINRGGTRAPRLCTAEELFTPLKFL